MHRLSRENFEKKNYFVSETEKTEDFFQRAPLPSNKKAPWTWPVFLPITIIAIPFATANKKPYFPPSWTFWTKREGKGSGESPDSFQTGFYWLLSFVTLASSKHTDNLATYIIHFQPPCWSLLPSHPYNNLFVTPSKAPKNLFCAKGRPLLSRFAQLLLNTTFSAQPTRSKKVRLE